MLFSSGCQSSPPNSPSLRVASPLSAGRVAVTNTILQNEEKMFVSSVIISSLAQTDAIRKESYYTSFICKVTEQRET